MCEFRDEVLSFSARCADDVAAYRGALLEQLHRPTFCFATLLGQLPTHPVYAAFLCITGRWLTNSTLTIISVSSQTTALVSSPDEKDGGGKGGGGLGPDYVAFVSVFIGCIIIFRLHKLIPSGQAQITLQLTVFDLL